MCCICKKKTFYIAARKGARRLQELSGEQRAEIIVTLSDMLLNKKDQIIEANAADLEIAKETGMCKLLVTKTSRNEIRSLKTRLLN